VLWRAAPREREVVEAGEIAIDRLTRCVHVRGRRLLFPAREYELLLKLAEQPTRVFTKEELLREVWGFRAMGRTRTLDSHASRLRRKIAAVTDTPYVLNEWGVGGPVSGGVGRWREVAWLRAFRPSRCMASRTASASFGH
jgi:DNA-binding response OmpR family regulator